MFRWLNGLLLRSCAILNLLGIYSGETLGVGIDGSLPLTWSKIFVTDELNFLFDYLLLLNLFSLFLLLFKIFLWLSC